MKILIGACAAGTVTCALLIPLTYSSMTWIFQQTAFWIGLIGSVVVLGFLTIVSHPGTKFEGETAISHGEACSSRHRSGASCGFAPAWPC